MTTRSPAVYLSEILSSMDKIERYVAGLSYDEFILSEQTVDAVERNTEKIGEAAAAIPADVRERLSEVPWKTIVIHPSLSYPIPHFFKYRHQFVPHVK